MFKVSFKRSPRHVKNLCVTLSIRIITKRILGTVPLVEKMHNWTSKCSILGTHRNIIGIRSTSSLVCL